MSTITKISDCIIQKDEISVRVWEPTDLSYNQHGKITFFDGNPYGEIETRRCECNIPVSEARINFFEEWRATCKAQKESILRLA